MVVISKFSFCPDVTQILPTSDPLVLNLLCLALTLVNVRNNANKTCKDVSAKQLRPSSVF